MSSVFMTRDVMTNTVAPFSIQACKTSSWNNQVKTPSWDLFQLLPGVGRLPDRSERGPPAPLRAGLRHQVWLSVEWRHPEVHGAAEAWPRAWTGSFNLPRHLTSVSVLVMQISCYFKSILRVYSIWLACPKINQLLFNCSKITCNVVWTTYLWLLRYNIIFHILSWSWTAVVCMP